MLKELTMCGICGIVNFNADDAVDPRLMGTRIIKHIEASNQGPAARTSRSRKAAIHPTS